MNQYYFIQGKVTTLNELLNVLSVYRFQEKRIVFTDGCFDLIHRGHIKFLAEASDLGDILIIGLNSDLSIGKIKGDGRPVQDQGTRSILTASLRFVDHVVLFDDENSENIIKVIRPDVLVKGEDFIVEDDPGVEFVNANGGKVVILEHLKGYSTAALIDKVKKLR
jgi:rfaE bifunctional protein nucleotidyltransferase chain/domain